ncbi:MAG: phage portal protein, partial [Acidimicrobiia bacterium]|nr:phage portal protein [Acidimicrobiia bacterium]
TFSNIEQQSIEYVTDALMPWAVRWEQEINRKLFPASDARRGMFSKHVFQSLLRGDQAARAAFFQGLFQIGALSPNDIRALEEMNPIDGGDRYFVPMNMSPVDEPAAMADERRVLPPSEDDDDDESAEAAYTARAIRPIFTDASDRIIRKEVRACDRARVKEGADWLHWLDRFYASHGDYIVEAFTPPSGVLAAIILGRDPVASDLVRVDEAIHAVAGDYVGSSKSELATARDRDCVSESVSYWSATRTAALADQVIDAVRGALA